MAHHLNNDDSMFSGNGEVPWHGLGNIVIGNPTAAEAIKAAGLDWTVSAQPLFATLGDDVLSVDTHKAAVRSDTGKILGIVGEGYKYVQNVDAFAFSDLLAGSGDVVYETAGSLDSGRRVWMLARLDGRMIEPVKGDRSVPYLLLSNSHDGSASLRAMLTTVRVACHNTLTMAQGAGSAVAGMDVKIRHSGKIEAKMEAARNVFARAIKSVDGYTALASKLADTAMTDEAWEALLVSLFPIADDAVKTKRTEEARDAVLDRAINGLGQDIPGVSGTAWAALNGVTEYATHIKGTRACNGRDAADAKLESLLFGSAARLGEDALAWLADYATTGRIPVPA